MNLETLLQEAISALETDIALQTKRLKLIRKLLRSAAKGKPKQVSPWRRWTPERRKKFSRTMARIRREKKREARA